MDDISWGPWKPVKGIWFLFGWRWYRERHYAGISGFFTDKEWKKGN